MPSVFVTRQLPVDPPALLHDALGNPQGKSVEALTVRVFPEPRPPTRAELVAGAAGADAILSLLSERIDGPVLDAIAAAHPSRTSALRIVANYAVGYDNIDVPACTARGVWVTNTPGVLTEATADLAFTLLLALARRVREGERLVRTGGFDGWSPTMLLGTELAGKVLGIYGAGRIGQAVARRGRAFGMEVLERGRGRGVAFDELIERSDVISIHTPLNDETRHAFDEGVFACMKNTALLINTARGPIVDEMALVDALAAGEIAGAGLDVYEDEPRVHPQLIGRDDVVLLPHLGSATHRTRRRMAETALANVAAVLRGERPPNAVNEL